ncbi:Component of the BRCA1-A complex [Geranomyces variabilis]|nr:Component of the BRCA1-A complex [Geranomyces variabilis]
MRHERIVFCVDVSQEAGCEVVGPPPGHNSNTITRLECAKLLMQRFIFQKSRMNPKHQFGVLTATDLTLWAQECTSDADLVIQNISRLQFENAQHAMWDLSTLFSALHDQHPDPATADYVLRVIIIYCRSNTHPSGPDDAQLAIFRANPNCFLDGIYIHDKANVTNQVQAIYDSLSLLGNEEDRFYELTREYRRFSIAMTKLLAHPIQRMAEAPGSYLLQQDPGPRHGTDDGLLI